MSDTDQKPGDAKPVKASRNRRKSRELALKGIYRNLLNQADFRAILRELADEPEFDKADQEYLRKLLDGVLAEREELDRRIAVFVDRPMQELSPIEHGILCLSAYELIFDLSIPYRVAINEGVELAKIYGGTDGHKYVNGVLDKLAAEARPGEVNRHTR
ncbi:transcription antitermination factor NusB [Methylovorus sp. MP688]|uniref:transcription antitermination factor NusB n=1 Tax=Methylovorus sp. (strain MP688) TaxID=887061 RepID=UPI0001EC4F5B|nr:transcription antitermination factor NusB [Methylovorus sp. MP688]ADQ85357.1 NusB antitermination factor [Methylovorus sp. MP688]